MTSDTAASAEAPDTFDEFSFLPHQAATLNAPTPEVRRLALALPDGRTLSGIRYGTDDVRVTVLHGAGLNAHTWDTTMIALGRPALALDLAGHGDSTWREDADYAPRTLAEDVAGALDAWTHAPQILVGHSLGGLTAAAVAAHRPDSVRHLLLVDIVPGLDPTAGASQLREFYEQTVFDSREALVDRALAFGLGGTREQARVGVFLNSRVRPDGKVEWKHHFARLAATIVPATGAEADGALRGEPSWEDLALVTAPITLVRARHGYLTDQDVAEFRRRLPGATVVDIAAPHNIQEVAPVELADLITSLAERRTSSDAPH